MVRLDMYGSDDIAFSWHKMGLGTDPRISKQLSNYDYSIQRDNETTCRDPSLFPRKRPRIKFCSIKLIRYYFFFSRLPLH